MQAPSKFHEMYIAALEEHNSGLLDYVKELETRLKHATESVNKFEIESIHLLL
jgi:hypothetical protein